MRWIMLAVAALSLGCSSSVAPERVRVLGAIAGYHADDPRIEIAPDGRRVTVRVTTYGGGCHSRGETEVAVRGMEALVTPYDYTAPPGTPCTQPLVSFPHETVVQFGTAGTARILVRGIDRSLTSSQRPEGDTIVVERTVEVL